MTSEKIYIAEGKVKGNLNDLEQVYKINYMLPEGEMGDKIEFAILLEKEGLSQGAYRSLRLTDPTQTRDLVLDMTKAHFMFLKKKGIITVENFEYQIKKIQDKVSEVMRSVMKEE